MRRQNPYITTYGFITTAGLLVGLGLMLWRSGGQAFSPGQLSAINRTGVTLAGFTSHSSFEAECELCHKPLETTQDVLCTTCHTRITIQIKTTSGTHGQIKTVNQCAMCHSDHHGNDYNPTQNAFKFFDHSVTTFNLVWHQVNYDASPLDCNACHITEGIFSFSDALCVNCHANQDFSFISQHDQAFGSDCTSCHNGEDKMTSFDHQSTAFPLEGEHGQLACDDCHNRLQPMDAKVENVQVGEGLFTATPNECVQCHGEPEIHQGMFSSECKTCHTLYGWLPASFDGEEFDHDVKTNFALVRHQRDFKDMPLLCRDCHQGGAINFKVQSCIFCHSKDDQTSAYIREHQEQFGLDCLSCHDGIDRMNDFNHDSLFTLDGQHAVITCEACHISKIFAGTPQDCVQCHAEPAIHAGSFGLQCQSCHSAQAWAPAYLQTHSFPLDHGKRVETDCLVCHIESYSAYTCYGCHDHKPESIEESHKKAAVSLEELQNCSDCHPTGLEHEYGSLQ